MERALGSLEYAQLNPQKRIKCMEGWLRPRCAVEEVEEDGGGEELRTAEGRMGDSAGVRMLDDSAGLA